ncbi:hypothetical protein UPYG_G00095630 [Umbra pygmaea]|uniref:Uncharacterized protein n=1 Tax=Umbra pygmaea TaxID=75934 RepID=A0ABD0XFP4_UMBPY
MISLDQITFSFIIQQLWVWRIIDHQKTRLLLFYHTKRGTMVQTLNSLKDLEDCRFGRSWPRHGLKLLYWFATDYITFDYDNQMVAEYDPRNGDFGFRLFHNRRECANNICKKLLPENGFQFYEAGNLHQPASKSLPDYVSEDDSGHKDDSNTDRLIISMRTDEIVDKVYVTQHENLTTFDRVNTYCISRGLLMIIRRHISLEDFLDEVGYSYQSHVSIRMQSAKTAAPGFWESYCTIL